MNTQTGGPVPHTCKALEHCHTLNERVADLEGLVRAIGQSASEDSNALRDLTNRMQGDAVQWHNRLARESKAQAVAIQALGGRLDAIFRPELAHCPTCTCGQTFKLSYEAVAPAAPDCGGCAGRGAHERWCPEVVGEKAARLGRLAEEADSLGDRIGANDPEAANYCYTAASRLSGMAQLARVER